MTCKLIYVIVTSRKNRKRSKELELLSKEVHGIFRKYADENIIDDNPNFYLFSKGVLKFAHNIISLSINDEIHLKIFDYSCSAHKNSRTRFSTQTIFLFSFVQSRFPSFLLHNNAVSLDYKVPELQHVLKNPLIYFKHSKIFSDNYEIQAADEVAIKRVFTDDIFDYIGNDSRLSIQCEDNKILFFEQNKVLDVKEIHELMHRNSTIVKTMLSNELSHDPLTRKSIYEQ